MRLLSGLIASAGIIGAVAQTVVLEVPVNYEDNTYYFVGGYNPNIYLVEVQYAAPHAMSILGSFPSGGSASYLTLADGILLAANEVDSFGGASNTGGITSWLLDGNETTIQVTTVNSIASKGSSPAFVTMAYSATDYVALVANYGGGNYGSFPVAYNGTLSADPVSFETDTGSGPVAGRQDSPHPHQIVPDPSGQFLFVPDLGTDKIMQYLFDENGKITANPQAAFVASQAGSGPRHIAFHPYDQWAYVTNELGNRLDMFDLDGNGTLTFRQSFAMVSPDVTAVNYPAEVQITYDGMFLYASNRGNATDNIVIYKIDPTDGVLTTVGWQKTGGQYPRFFTLASYDDWILVANQNSDSLVMFERDLDTGALTQMNSLTGITQPTCIVEY